MSDTSTKAKKRRRRRGCFRGTEIELPTAVEVSPRVEQALRDCDDFREDVWEFDPWNERICRGLAPAYRLYTLFQLSDDTVVAKVIQDAVFADRKRKLSTKKPAVAAVYLALKPRSKLHQKRCSDYATILVHFYASRVEPNDFVARMRNTTLEECLKAVREGRRLSKEHVRAQIEARAKRETEGSPPPAGDEAIVVEQTPEGQVEAPAALTAARRGPDDANLSIGEAPTPRPKKIVPRPGVLLKLVVEDAPRQIMVAFDLDQAQNLRDLFARARSFSDRAFFRALLKACPRDKNELDG